MSLHIRFSSCRGTDKDLIFVSITEEVPQPTEDHRMTTIFPVADWLLGNAGEWNALARAVERGVPGTESIRWIGKHTFSVSRGAAFDVWEPIIESMKSVIVDFYGVATDITLDVERELLAAAGEAPHEESCDGYTCDFCRPGSVPVVKVNKALRL